MPYPQPALGVHHDRQLRQPRRRRHQRMIRTTRNYHSYQNYDIRENLASGATGDAYIEANYTENMMSLTLARGYLKRLLENSRVAKYLRDHHGELVPEFEAITKAEGV